VISSGNQYPFFCPKNRGVYKKCRVLIQPGSGEDIFGIVGQYTVQGKENQDKIKKYALLERFCR
jgi:hypothetical protein